MGLKDEHKLREAKARAANAIQLAEDLLAQESSDATDLATLKTAISADVAGDVWNANRLNRAAEIIAREQRIAAKKTSLQTELGKIKAHLTDPAHITEIDNVIASLA